MKIMMIMMMNAVDFSEHDDANDVNDEDDDDELVLPLPPPHLPKSSILFSLEAYFPSASLYILFLPCCT